jgi:hypothetical protein
MDLDDDDYDAVFLTMGCGPRRTVEGEVDIRRWPFVSGHAKKHAAKQLRDSTLPLRIPPPVDLITDIGLVVIDQPKHIWVCGCREFVTF